MKYFRLHFLLPTLLIFLVTCKNADSPTGIDANGNISTTITGVVTDESSQPIADVTVTAYGKVTTTNKYGMFIFQNTTVPAARCFIICKKNGYFPGSRAETPKAGGATELRLTLQSNKADYFLDPAFSTTITIGKASVTFPAAPFVTVVGEPYTGIASVVIKFLDPTKSSFYNSFSGDMTGKRLNGTQTDLLSYGVFRVQVSDNEGNELKLATGKKVKLSYPIPVSLQKNAPDSIPLWYFDETLGIWKEEGSAAKSIGNIYTGTVSHFTDWNCDNPTTESGIVSGRIVCEDEGIPGVYVTVGQRKILTDQAGYFSLRVPTNVEFVISVRASENNGIAADDLSVSAFGKDEYRKVKIQLTTCPAFVKGTVVDCNNHPIASTVILSYTSGQYITNFTTTGNFKLFVPQKVTMTIEATSYDGKIVPSLPIGILNAGDVKDMGYLSACNDNNSITFNDIDLGEGSYGGHVLSQDGSLIAITFYRDSQFHTAMYNAISGIKLWEHLNESTYSNFTNDGTKLMVRMNDSSVLVLNSSTGSVITKYKNTESGYPFLLTQDGLSIISLKFNKDVQRYYRYSISEGTTITKDVSTLKYVSDGLKEIKLLGIREPNQLVFETIASGVVTDGMHNNSYSYTGYELLFWDLTDNKINLKFYFSSSGDYMCGTCFSSVLISQDFNIATKTRYGGPPHAVENDIGVFNINTGEHIYNKLIKPDAIGNDLTYVDGTSNVNSPKIYNMVNGSIIKILPKRTESSMYFQYMYSANSQYLAGSEFNNYKSAPYPLKIRIWKLK